MLAGVTGVVFGLIFAEELAFGVFLAAVLAGAGVAGGLDSCCCSFDALILADATELRVVRGIVG